MIVGIDFDNTIAVTDYPKIEEEVFEAKKYINKLYDEGYIVVIWTCREGEHLEKAKDWLKEKGFKYDKINENLEHRIEFFNNTDSRKIGADILIDDRQITPLPSWHTIYNQILERNYTFSETFKKLDKEYVENNRKSEQTVIMLKGLPASGKSTYAKELVDTRGFTRLNKDCLREMLHCGMYDSNKEELINSILNHMLEILLFEGKDIVIDNTNLNPKHEEKIIEVLENYNLCTNNCVQLNVKDFTNVPLQTCIERDRDRYKCVGEKVIKDMHNKYLS